MVKHGTAIVSLLLLTGCVVPPPPPPVMASAVPAPPQAPAPQSNCREFQQTIMVGGKTEHGYGTTCQQPDGSWKVVADQPQGSQSAPPPSPPPVAAVPAYPYPYYPYPYYYAPPAYGSLSIGGRFR